MEGLRIEVQVHMCKMCCSFWVVDVNCMDFLSQCGDNVFLIF